MIPAEEPVDERYRLRFSLGQGGQSIVSYGYSIKFVLIDEKNLLLYRNIMEIGYSVVKRAVKEKRIARTRKYFSHAYRSFETMSNTCPSFPKGCPCALT